jgi:ABC-type glycerol-3-phosphate transport system substrate-binding protein
MKKMSFALVGAAALALAACGGSGDDTLAENTQENFEAAADNFEAAAENAATPAQAETLENQADALEAEGARKEEAIDDADVNAANSAEAAAAVNAM